MNNNYGIPVSLLHFLKECIYNDVKSYYSGLNDATLAELEAEGKSFGMVTWFYRYLYEVLPEEKRTEYQKTYQARQAKALMGMVELNRLYRVLSAQGLRFVPIKGADLAYRLYPDAALRFLGDWDIWFHPDDCQRALAVLTEDGWKVSESYSKNHNAVRNCGIAHHFSPCIRGQYIVEPHFKLPNFDRVDLYEMWEHTNEYPLGNGQRVLSPEMNLLMLARHAASKSYYHAQIPKLLTDVAMVMKEGVDFVRLRELADHWHLPYPGNLLAAFPEFFPAEIIDIFDANLVKKRAFRKICELRGQLGEQEYVSLALSRYDANGKVVRGVMKHILTLSPNKIRITYHLPQHGAWGQLVWMYIAWFFSRSWIAVQWYSQRNRKLKEYGDLVESVESE